MRTAYAFWVNVMPVSLAQAIKLFKIANIFSAIVGRKATVLDIVLRLMRNMRAFEEHSGARFVDERITHILQVVMSSVFWQTILE